MPQSYLLVHIKALAVRPAVGNQVCHLLDGLFRLFGVMLCTGKAHKSAHSAFLSARSVTQALVAEIAFVFAVIVQLVLGVPDGPLEGEVLLAEQLVDALPSFISLRTSASSSWSFRYFLMMPAGAIIHRCRVSAMVRPWASPPPRPPPAIWPDCSRWRSQRSWTGPDGDLSRTACTGRHGNRTSCRSRRSPPSSMSSRKAFIRLISSSSLMDIMAA